MAVESNTQLGLAGTTDSNEDDAANAWGAQHLEEMQALEGMDPEDQRAIESYERRQMEGKGVPLGEPMWGGGPVDKDAGIAGDTAAFGAAFVVGGTLDTLGAIPAGLAGLTALTAEAVTGTTPEGKDFYGEENVSGATRVVESISNVWNEYVTKNALEAIMPESLEDDTEEMHQRVQSVFMQGMDAVARGARVIAAPTVLTLRNQGVDTTKFEAAVDSHARSSATLAMLVLGMKSLPGQKGKGGTISAADMDMVLGDAARTAAAKYTIDPNVQAPASQAPAGMPSYASYQAGKQAGPAEQFGAPPQRSAPEGAPVQGEIPLNEPYHAQGVGDRGPIATGNIPRHPTSPTKGQMNLPFDKGYEPHSPAYRPMAEYHLEGEWMPAEAPFHPLAEYQTRSIIEGTYENLTPNARQPRLEKPASAEAKSAHRAHEAVVDEMNHTVALQEVATGKLSPMNLVARMPEIAIQTFKEMMADAAGLRKAGVRASQVTDAVGGMARQRVAASQANEASFGSAMVKVMNHPAVEAIIAKTPEEAKAPMNALAEKLQKSSNTGDRFGMLKDTERGKTMETPHMIYPKSMGASPHVAKFTVNELISLYRELFTAQPGIFVPGRGTMTKLTRGYESLKQQAIAKWGNKATNAQEGLVSARGEFYTPAEMQMLKQLIDSTKHDFPTLTAKTKTLPETFADASMKFRMDVSPDARAASGKNRQYTLEDHGMTAREQPGFRGKPGEQGYFNIDAFNLLDPLRKKWAAKAGAYKRPRKSSTYKVRDSQGRKVAGKSYTGGAVTRKEMTKRAFIREYVFGGKMIGALQRESIRHMDEYGKYGLARVTAMLDQFPKAMWREKMGNVQSFYQLHTKAFADLIADSGNGVSLAATLAPFQAKFMTGPRRYFSYLPGGLTLQRMAPKRVKAAFLDLTTGTAAKTELGMAMRRYGDYLYRYGQENGVEMATYLRNWYPVVLKKLNTKNREAFVALAESKAKTPATRARARQEVEHVFDLAFENGGLIPADAKPGLNGKHLNAEMRRQFFDKFTMEELRPFIVNDPGRAMYSYAKGLARRVANNARWGAKEEVWKGALKQAVKEGEEVGRPLSKEDLATLEAGRQILAHTYMTAPQWYVGMMRLGVAWQNAAKLGLVTVGSLAEIGVGLLNPAMQKHYAKAMVTTGVRGLVQNSARAIWRDIPQARGRRLAEAIGRSVDVEMHDVLTATHAADLQSVGSNIVFQLNGLHALTNMLQDINVAAFEGALKESVAKEFNHRLGRRKKTDFDRADADFMSMYGIDMEAALAWHRDGGKIGGAFWDQQYAPALLKYLNDTVMTPRGTNMPRWMSNPWLTPIRHLMTYTSVFANTVLPDMLWNLKGGVRADAPHNLTLRGVRGAKAAGGVAAIYGLGMLAENLLDEIKYGGQDEHPLRDRIKDDDVWTANQIARYLNRTGVYGLGMAKLFDAYESYHYGRTDYRFVDGAFLTEASAGAEVLGLGLLAGEIDAKQAAKWLVRNGIPVHAATIPRDKKAPLAEFMPTRQQMEDDLAKWLDDHVPGFDRKSSGTWKP